MPALLFAASLSCGCRPGDAAPKPGPPILLIGADGLEWEFVLPLVREGKMPALTALMERGCFGLLETTYPTQSPIIWTSVATGKIKEKHGIKGFTVNEGGDPPSVRLYNSRDRHTKALWDIVSEARRSVNVIGWWLTWPADPVNGVMVSQTNTIDDPDADSAEKIWKGGLYEGVDGQVYPPARQAEMLAHLTRVAEELPALTRRVYGEFRYPQSKLTAALWTSVAWAFRADSTYFSIAQALAAEPNRAELTAIYFGTPDVVGHRFFRYARPELFKHRPTDEELEDYGRILPVTYIRFDEMLSNLLDLYPAESTVIICSDHGMLADNVEAFFDPNRRPGGMNSGHHRHAPAGFFAAAGPRIRRIAPPKPLAELGKSDLTSLGSVLDIAPTILLLMDIPIGADMDGRPMLRIIEGAATGQVRAATIATHDTAEWLRARSAAPLPGIDESERIEQLKSLGYLRDDGTTEGGEEGQ